MGLISDIKTQAKKSANNLQKVLYFKDGTQHRVRFLEDGEDGMQIVTHRNFDKGINTICVADLLDEECEYCDSSDISTRSEYVYCVYCTESKEVKLLIGAANKWSPIPQLAAMYDSYGTLTDRDYVITQNGSKQNKSFSVVPMDKSKLRNKKAKPFSEKAKINILLKAFTDNEDEEEEAPKKSKKKKGKKKKSKILSILKELDWDDLEDVAIELEIDEDEIADCEDEKELIKLIKDESDEEDIKECLEELELIEEDD